MPPELLRCESLPFGARTFFWLDCSPERPQQEFVVCGFIEGKGSRKHFEALLLARTETDGCAMSVTPVPGLAKRD